LEIKVSCNERESLACTHKGFGLFLGEERRGGGGLFFPLFLMCSHDVFK